MEVFPVMEGYDTLSSFMKKRVLLEFVMVRLAARNENLIPAQQIIDEAGIDNQDEDLSNLFRAVAQNQVLFINHQELYGNSPSIAATLHLNCFIECNPFIVNLFVRKLDFQNTYSFNQINEDARNNVVEELTEKVEFMKKNLSNQQRKS